MHRRTTLICAAGVAVAALGTTGCGGAKHSDGSTSAAAERAASTPSVELVFPEDGQTVSPTFTARTQVSGRGRVHFRLDGGRYDTPRYTGGGRVVHQTGPAGRYSQPTGSTITYRGVPAGEHTLQAVLADGSGAETGASAASDFTVR